MSRRRASRTRRRWRHTRRSETSPATAVVLGNLAELEFGEGQVEQALRLAGEALEIHYVGRTRRRLPSATTTSLPIALRWEIVDGAREAAREGLRLARQVQAATSHRDRVAASRADLGAAWRSERGRATHRLRQCAIQRTRERA